MFEFYCDYCGKNIKADVDSTEVPTKCPKCNSEIPGLSANQTRITTSMLEAEPSKNRVTEPSLQPPMEIYNDTSEPPKRKLPWMIDILLYPASLDGMIYIGIFIVLYLIVGWSVVLLGAVRHYGSIIQFLFLFMLAGYIFYYITYCIYDSSKGYIRAPAIEIQYLPNVKDLVFEIILTLGSIAICFFPAAIYYILTSRLSLFFWIAAAIGMFFFPMAFLAAVLFEAFDSLNPITIISSILKTFFSYCGLVLLIYTLILLMIALSWALNYLPLLRKLSGPVSIYIALICAHILGRFYFKNKNRLYWGI